jgi:hypothetical protein
LPLTELSTEHQPAVLAAMAQAGVAFERKA